MRATNFKMKNIVNVLSLIKKVRLQCMSTKLQNNEFFGYKQVEKGERQFKVNQVFQKVSTYYDDMNDYMSMGIHRLWKNKFVNKIVDPKFNQKFLDLAGGTGDIAFRILDNLALQIFNDKTILQNKYKDGFKQQGAQFPIVTVCDISSKMIDYGKFRMQKLNLEETYINWVIADARNLPFPENTFDTITVSFGLRNMSDIPNVLNNVYRVLKPNGKFLILEFSHPTNFVFSELYKFYSFNIIPVIGRIAANDWKSYQYLVESIQMFYNQEQLANLLKDAGFKNVYYENWLNGLVAVHHGIKKINNKI